MRDSMRNTFMSFQYYYGNRTDYEIIIIEDTKNFANKEEHKKLLNIISDFGCLDVKLIRQDLYDTMDAGVAYNWGVKNSIGEFVVITNPEGFHNADVLAGLDQEFVDKSKYVVCACLNVKNFKDVTSIEDMKNGVKYDFIEWYQHSVHNKRKLNFCTAMSKANYDRIGGFDEEYRFGYAVNDCDFLFKIIKNKIPIVQRDDLLTLHIDHPRVYGITPTELSQKIEINRALFKKKWEGVNLWA